eukprot:2476487-Rhodomonas_salina.1
MLCCYAAADDGDELRRSCRETRPVCPYAMLLCGVRYASMRCPVCSYAVSGTHIAHAARRAGSTLPFAPTRTLPYAPTRTLTYDPTRTLPYDPTVSQYLSAAQRCFSTKRACVPRTEIAYGAMELLGAVLRGDGERGASRRESWRG